MAFDRRRAKQLIRDPEESDAALASEYSHADELWHRLGEQQNRHQEAMLRAELGIAGRLTGGPSMAPVNIALIAMLAGGFGAAYCFHLAAIVSPDKEFWSQNAKACLAASASALSFIFGRSSTSKK